MRRRIKSVPIKQQYTESFRKASDFLRLVLPVNSDLSYVNPFSAFFPINHCFLKLFRPVFQFSIRNTGHYPNLMMGIRAVLILPLAKNTQQVFLQFIIFFITYRLAPFVTGIFPRHFYGNMRKPAVFFAPCQCLISAGIVITIPAQRETGGLFSS